MGMNKQEEESFNSNCGDCFKFTLTDGTEKVIQIDGATDLATELGQPWIKREQVKCSDHGLRDIPYVFDN